MNKRSLTIGNLFRIPIRIHFTFLLALPFLVWVFANNIQYFTQNTNIINENLVLSPYVLGFIMAILLFISVLFHEMAHSLVARHRNIEIEDITLMLLGGISHLDDFSEKPSDEAIISLSGPALSLVLGFLLLQFHTILPDSIPEDLQLIFLYTGQLNIVLAIFNLLPAFPTDGGRVTRAIIAQKTSQEKATRIATTIGKGFAIIFGLVGIIIGNILLMFVGFYLYISASQEKRFNNIKTTLSDLNVSDLMSKNVTSVAETDSLQSVLDTMFTKRHSGFPVLKNKKVTGIITMEDIQKANSDKYHTIPVKQVMASDIQKVHPDDDLYQAFQLLFEKDIGRLVVINDNSLVGIITRSDILKGFQAKKLKESAK